MDNEPIGFVEGWAQRAANAFLGHRMGEKMTPNKQFLIDIEYDSRPAMTKVDGIELTSQQRSRIFDKMGELGTFSRALTTMRTTKGEAYLKTIKEFRENGVRWNRRIGLSHGCAWIRLDIPLDNGESRFSAISPV